MTIPVVASDALGHLPHGFFGRQGGISGGDFASLNMSLSVGDDTANVDANRAGACRVLGYDPEALALVRQTHSSNVSVIAEPSRAQSLIEADAMVTNRRGVLLGILTADCAPVLLADGQAGVIGAVHAGWRGAAGDILGAALRAMQELGAAPARIKAVIGPTISAANYEVGSDFATALLQRHPTAASRIARVDGIEHFDLPGFVADRLRAAGVEAADDLGICTYADPRAWFSHRRATHEGTKTGRQLALIALP